MITIDQARLNIGRGVVYRRPWCETEQGVITSVSEVCVFVRYSGDIPQVRDAGNDGLVCLSYVDSRQQDGPDLFEEES